MKHMFFLSGYTRVQSISIARLKWGKSLRVLSHTAPPHMTPARGVTTIYVLTRFARRHDEDERSDVLSVYSSDAPCGRHGRGGVLAKSGTCPLSSFSSKRLMCQLGRNAAAICHMFRFVLCWLTNTFCISQKWCGCCIRLDGTCSRRLSMAKQSRSISKL